jgi:hypothetical protein
MKEADRGFSQINKIPNRTFEIRNKKIPLPYNSQGVPCFGYKIRCSYFTKLKDRLRSNPLFFEVLSIEF